MSKLLGFVAGAVAFVSASVIASLVLSVITFVHIKDNGAHHHVEPLTTAASRSPISTALTFEPASTGTPAPLPSTAPHASSTVKTPPPVPPEPSTRQFSTDTPAPKTPSTRTASSASTTTSTVPSVTTPVTTPPPLRPHEGPVFCPNVGIANSSSAWQQAASYLLYGIDESVDPCEDFYGFTCKKFLERTDLEELGVGRYSTYQQAQREVHAEIVRALNPVDIADDGKWSETERITKAALEACVAQSTRRTAKGSVKEILTYLAERLGGIPFLNISVKSDLDLFEVLGNVEQERALGTFMSSWVSVDYKNVERNALYISQPSLPMPREFYVLPQFTDELQSRHDAVRDIMEALVKAAVGSTSQYDELISKAARDVVRLESQIAKASWPDTEMRNYAKMYNPFSPEELAKTYSAIRWSSYLNALLSSVENGTLANEVHVILSQPSYFGFLNSLFSQQDVDNNMLANYLITQILFEDADFMGDGPAEQARKVNYVSYAQRRGRGVKRIGRQFSRQFDEESDPTIPCMNTIMAYMPYGPGYVYVKSKENRDNVVKDVKTMTRYITMTFAVIKFRRPKEDGYFCRQLLLYGWTFWEMLETAPWMDDRTSIRATMKVERMVENYGWPAFFGDFVDFSDVDSYHKEDYYSIINAYERDRGDFYTIINILRRGLENREAFRALAEPSDRSNFLQSPAMVNAWYQPERNSITFPYAIWNPPYYNIDYPKAYNFGGQGGTGGHELVHGFDDEGIQFGHDGSLAECHWNRCGWMEKSSLNEFTRMAQCVVTQYSSQCCPSEVVKDYCANGATTQGENIADLGGQQAAYIAYEKFIRKEGVEEQRLPGLEGYTPAQIFWITYGYSWCMKQSGDSLIKQLLTNPHAPSSCRTNQVVQDIPAFASDFNCKVGQKMYPKPEERCKVWFDL